ncbi:isoaspartyl peptidase/L-asparaginase family protein [Aurantiacibacter aquimixticola]|uniref:Isoaspartyl peptidase n=1 Tax=Aurantiacibacter aquimixticola TaxID=1958945 RepID=A0A419RSB4_9SPHN|nr:isoaspartyl peptidase/L-asparaginase [Aurantiacibacter aquimixticola]RJY08659.1 isoaspartyl peptidase/L-asparaginase [Aurantiacibacter aquimixticola]
MLRYAIAFLAFLLPATAAAHDHDHDGEPASWSIAIHGGAGTLERSAMTPEREAAYTASLQAALDAVAEILRAGGTAEDAVIAAITLMEDDPLFNAGRGAVLTFDGGISHDASLMLGDSRAAGAVAGISDVRHPILLAREVMRDGRHVFLSGEGAEEFADDTELERMDSEWFVTEPRARALERFRQSVVSHADDDEHRFGTVGAVVRDMHGNLAAGTSTGGMTGKRWDRIGDSPVIGAGTYADNRSCAVSATGSGEYFIRAVVAKSICDLMLLSGMGPMEAGDNLMAEVEELGGSGGVIVVSPSGETAFSFNTSGMYRGRADSTGVNEVGIFGD